MRVIDRVKRLIHRILKKPIDWVLYASNKKNSIFFPFVKSNIVINGIEMSFVTHYEDKELGRWLRKEGPVDTFSLADLEVLKDSIKPGHCVADIGANLGLYSIYCSKLVTDLTVLSFEPDPVNYSMLIMNTVINDAKNVIPFHCALGSKQEFIDFFKSSKNFGDHRSLTPKAGDLGEEEFEKLKARLLMVNPVDFLKESLKNTPFKHIDVAKIDTQGNDFAILRSCLPLFRKGTVVTIEYSPYHINFSTIDRVEVESILNEFTSIQKINPIGEHPRLTDISMDEILKYYADNCRKYKGYFDLKLVY